MSQFQPVPLVGGSYEYRSRGISVQRTVNLYPEQIEDPIGDPKIVLMHTPGDELVTTVGDDTDAECRGFWYSSTSGESRSLLYACYGTKIYRIKPDFTKIEVGQVASGTGPVSITDNGFDLVVADGTALFRADLLADDSIVPTTWAQVDLPYLSGTEIPIRPSYVLFLNQRLVINSQRNEFYYSNLASTVFEDEFGVPNFYSAESSADTIRAMAVNNGRLWLLGERSYELWSASGPSSDDPFSAVSGNAASLGIMAPRSLASLHEFVFWLGGSDAGRNTVFMAEGLNRPQRISTNALESQIARLGDAEGATGWAYYNEGHLFYVLSFRAARRTFVYDVYTKMWHERATRDWSTGEDYAWEAQYAVTAYNDVYFGAINGNRLLKLDPDRYVDYNDRPIVRRRIGPIYAAAQNPISIREFLVDMEVGTTPLLAGLGRDPQAMLSVSLDGGYTYRAADWRSIGAQGEYWENVKWSNLGTGKKIVVDLTFSDPSPITIYGAMMAAEVSSRR